jgi:DNA-binding NarL/FixJ family response regulator
MTRILIADDHEVVRRGLNQIISETGDLVVAGEASRGPEALEKILREEYDVVLLDISMPGMSGLDVLKQVKEVKPALPVLILTMYPEEQFATRALQAGASGYLTKESAPNELISAIRKIRSGGKYISASLAERLADVVDTTLNRPAHESLSDREFQVLRMISVGKTVSEIADDLSLSVKTVSTYRTRILEKLDLRNNSEIIRYAIKQRLVE